MSHLQPKFLSRKCAFSARASRDSEATQAVEGAIPVTGSPKQRTCTSGLQPQRRDAAASSQAACERGGCGNQGAKGAKYSTVVWDQQPRLYQHCNITILQKSPKAAIVMLFSHIAAKDHKKNPNNIWYIIAPKLQLCMPSFSTRK